MDKSARHVFQCRADHGPGAQYVIPVLLRVATPPQAGIAGHVKDGIRRCRHHQCQFGGIIQRSLYDLNAFGLKRRGIAAWPYNRSDVPAFFQQLVDDVSTEKPPGPTHKCHWHGHAPLCHSDLSRSVTSNPS